jgi:hypothetical protein
MFESADEQRLVERALLDQAHAKEYRAVQARGAGTGEWAADCLREAVVLRKIAARIQR